MYILSYCIFIQYDCIRVVDHIQCSKEAFLLVHIRPNMLYNIHETNCKSQSWCKVFYCFKKPSKHSLRVLT